MNTRIASIFFVVIDIFSLKLNAQYSFEREYSILSSAAMVELSDGFCVASAWDTATHSLPVIFRTDRKGSIIWSKKFRNDTLIRMFPISMNLTADSSYLISGHTEELKSNGWCCQYHIFCIKTDKNGTLLWSKKLGTDSLNEFAWRSILADDGGLVMSAIRNDTDYYSYSSVFKLNSNGNLEWCTNITDLNSMSLISPLSLPNGEIICSGSYLDSYDHLAALVCKLNANGNLLWSKSYSFDVTLQSWSIVPTLCGYFIVGNTDSTCCPHGNPLVMKIDEDGNFLWAKEYANWFSGQALAAVETCDGGAVFTTWVQTGLSTSAGLTKIDSSGIAQWTHLYGSNEYGDGINILHTADNGFISSGSLNQAGTPLRLYKANSLGGISCNDTLVYPSNITKTCTVSDVGFASNGIPIKNLSFNVSNFNISDSIICLDSFAVSSCVPKYCGATQIISLPEKSFNLSPNPASSFFTLTYETQNEIVADITDAFGREVKRFTIYSQNQKQIVWVNDLPDGIYLLSLREENRIESIKLIVER